MHDGQQSTQREAHEVGSLEGADLVSENISLKDKD